jgi:hypothetical protein
MHDMIETKEADECPATVRDVRRGEARDKYEEEAGDAVHDDAG